VTVIGVKAGTSGGFVRAAGGAGRRAASSGFLVGGDEGTHFGFGVGRGDGDADGGEEFQAEVDGVRADHASFFR
jgi:hypothetical protein